MRQLGEEKGKLTVWTARSQWFEKVFMLIS